MLFIIENLFLHKTCIRVIAETDKCLIFYFESILQISLSRTRSSHRYILHNFV